MNEKGKVSGNGLTAKISGLKFLVALEFSGQKAIVNLKKRAALQKWTPVWAGPLFHQTTGGKKNKKRSS